MGKKKGQLILEIDTTQLKTAETDISTATLGLEKTFEHLKETIDTTFALPDWDIKKFDGTFTQAISKLKNDLQELKTAFTQAAEPVGYVLIPVLDLAVEKVTGLVQSVGLVLGALLGTDQATKKIQDATKAEEKLKKTTTSTGKAAKRTLASFDQINRLGSGSAGKTTVSSATGGNTLPETATDTLTPQLQAIVDKIMALLEPVRQIDFTPLRESLARLGEAFANLGGLITQSLQWVWYEILVPLGKWVIEEAGPATVDLLTRAFELLRAVLEPVLEGIQNLKVYLEPVVAFIGETVVFTLEKLSEQFRKVTQVFQEKGQKIQEIFTMVGECLAVVWGEMYPILEAMREVWGRVIDFVGDEIANLVSMAIDVFHGLMQFISGVLTGDWEKAWEGLKTIFTGFVNGVIGAVNGMLRGVVEGINAIIRALNQVKFTLPNWDILGKLAGKSYGISLKTVSVPQIPYLAKGAVLPANRPFLAMVGDQKHGTNIEAPLTTIQEAVALVMEDMIASNMAGQEAIVGVLQELLEAVLGIQVGDEVIGRAVQRYNRKMAIMKGGYV